MTSSEAIDLLESRGFKFYRQTKQLMPSSDYQPDDKEREAMDILIKAHRIKFV